MQGAKLGRTPFVGQKSFFEQLYIEHGYINSVTLQHTQVHAQGATCARKRRTLQGSGESTKFGDRLTVR